MAEQAQEMLKPVYIPYRTFIGYIAGLKGTTVPHMLDNSARPPTMGGGIWRQLTSALQFLRLIDESKTVQQHFESLVSAYETPQWHSAVKEHVLPAYSEIVDGMPMENATQGQLNKCFREKASVEGQMLQKCVRFYLHALKEADVKYSPHFVMRQATTGKTSNQGGSRKKFVRPKLKKTDKKEGKTNVLPETPPVSGLLPIPIPSPENPQRVLYVPGDLTIDDCTMINTMLTAIAKRLQPTRGK